MQPTPALEPLSVAVDDATLNQQNLDLAPIVIENITQPVDLVRVEKSLHSLGFFASTTNRETSRTVVQVIRRPDGQRIQAKAVIEGIQSLGLPTTADRDKYMAFMKIALDQRDQEGQLTNPVQFTGADMIKMLRLRKGGFHYDEINDWCKRMVATTIMSEASIFLADRKQFATDTFHVFDRVVLVGEQLNDGSRSEYYQVYLSHWQLTNLNQGYMLPLDFNAYLKLKRDIGKALFGHLSVWFYASRGQPVEKRYADLCQLLNIRCYPHLSKARSVLAPSLNELMDIGYLSDWELVRSSNATDFKLIFSPGKRLFSLEHFAPVVSAESRKALEEALPEWVKQLIERGVAERKARQLALDVADGQHVPDQIEYAEYLVQQDSRSRRKIANPSGFIIWAIESNLTVPETFLTSRKRQVLESRDRAENDQQFRVLQMEYDYEEFCQREIRKKREACYPTEERLNTAIREQLKIIRKEQPNWYDRASEPMRRDVAMGRLNTLVRESMELASFETWSKQDSQRRLF
jgi:Replication initiator protein A